MSAEEMREYCQGLCSYNLKVEVRLKNGSEILVGRIASVQSECFQLLVEGAVQELRFIWVARIKNA